MSVAWQTAERAHAVQFYQDERFLHHAIAAFFAGAAAGEPLVMVARRRTFDAVVALMANARDLSTTELAEQIAFVDVDDVVREFMDGRTLMAERVQRGFAQMVTDLRGGRTGTMWLYGETVGVLCSQQNHAAAVHIEQLWNANAPDSSVVVLCGYDVAHFAGDANDGHLRDVCREHQHIIPAEDFTGGHHLATAVAVAPTIYVVDDDGSVRSSLGRLFLSHDWQVETFDSAEAFLAEVDGDATGCLVLDVQLGGMSGLELQRRMSAMGWRMPVVAMSASPDPQVQAAALRQGARAFLRKPFDAHALIDAVTRALATTSR